VPVLLNGESPLSNRRTTVAILATSSCPSFDATALLLQAAAHSFASASVCAPLQYSLLGTCRQDNVMLYDSVMHNHQSQCLHTAQHSNGTSNSFEGVSVNMMLLPNSKQCCGY
jgi:hypothetical protein